MCVRSTIMPTLKQVAVEHKRTLAPLTDDLVLIDSGLDSLSLAVLVVRLEEELDVDPFSPPHNSVFPQTLSDLIAVYQHVAKSDAGKSKALSR